MKHLHEYLVIIIGVGLGLLYWILDSAVMAFIFDMGSFGTLIFEPDT